MEDVLERIRTFVVGADAWVQKRPWLRGGPHHAILVVALMAVGAIWQAAFAWGLPLVAVYGAQFADKQTEDNTTDFGFPLAVFLLWHISGAGAALLALALGVVVWWAVVHFNEVRE